MKKLDRMTRGSSVLLERLLHGGVHRDLDGGQGVQHVSQEPRQLGVPAHSGRVQRMRKSPEDEKVRGQEFKSLRG